MTRLVGITGRARSGKDTAAEHFVRAGWVRYALADPVRAGLSVILGIPTYLFEGSSKEQPIGWLGRSPRELMQSLGTEWGRTLVHGDLWCLLAQRALFSARCTGACGLVVPDVRFENEARWVRENGGLVVHLCRRDAKAVRRHVSESGVAFADGDATVTNDGSPEELGARLFDLMRELGHGRNEF